MYYARKIFEQSTEFLIEFWAIESISKTLILHFDSDAYLLKMVADELIGDQAPNELKQVKKQ